MRKFVRNRVQQGPGPEPSRTKQSFAAECNVNNIVARFPDLTQLGAGSGRQPRFGDISGVEDLHSAMNMVFEAEARFAELPSAVRSRFRNDPVELVNFLGDENNRDEAVKLGLVNGPPEPAEGAAVPSPAPDGGDEAKASQSGS